MKLTAASLFCVLLFLSGFAGCAAYRPLQIEPVTKKKAVAPIVPKFTSSYYYFDRDHNLYFILRNKTTDKDTNQPVDQILTIRVFWRPIGGTTSLNNSSLNATYRYVLMTPDTVAMYEGAGFVRLWGKNGKKILQARIMEGDLRLTESSVAFVDTLGRAHVRGNLSATYDDIRAFDMLMDAHREFFARSLLSKPPASATQPGEPREENNPWPLEPPPGPIVVPPTTNPAPPATQQ